MNPNRYNGYTKLPTKVFKVRVPMMATYSDEEVEILGYPIFESSEGDKKQVYKDFSTVCINLDTMIDHYIAGYPIRIVEREDIAEIFNILEKYIEGRESDVNYSINKIHIGKDDRIDQIDKFANEMFGLNKVNIVKKSVNASNGFNLGLMPMAPIVDVKEIGIMSGYQNNPSSTYQNRSYLVDNTPQVNMDKIVRTSPLKNRRPIRLDGGE